jgi:FkbM family methyltransferase
MNVAVAHKSKELVRRFLSDKIKGHAILSGPLRGARIVTSWHDYPGAILGTTESSLLSWFQAHVQPGETWLDIGAHYGYTAIALSRLVGSRGRVFAFEPVPRTAASLQRTRALNQLDQLTIVPLALSDAAALENLHLHASRGMADSTLHTSGVTATIRAVSLDAIWDSLAGQDLAVHGVKIDVQGMELAVLTGMRRLLAARQPKLIVEFHRGVSRRLVLHLLSSVGYSAAFEPVDPKSPAHEIANDHSYFFPPTLECAFSSTPSITARS